MARTLAKKDKNGKVLRRKGYLYFVGSDGKVYEAKMKKGGTKGHRVTCPSGRTKSAKKGRKKSGKSGSTSKRRAKKGGRRKMSVAQKLLRLERAYDRKVDRVAGTKKGRKKGVKKSSKKRGAKKSSRRGTKKASRKTGAKKTSKKRRGNPAALARGRAIRQFTRMGYTLTQARAMVASGPRRTYGPTRETYEARPVGKMYGPSRETLEKAAYKARMSKTKSGASRSGARR